MCPLLLSLVLNVVVAEDKKGYFSDLMDKDEYIIPITKIPEEPKSIMENEISELVKNSIQNSLVRILDIEYPITFKGKTTAKAACSVLDKPCWAYLTLNDKNQWEVVSITTKESVKVNEKLKKITLSGIEFTYLFIVHARCRHPVSYSPADGSEYDLGCIKESDTSILMDACSQQNFKGSARFCAQVAKANDENKQNGK
jgi:hypothetical protein